MEQKAFVDSHICGNICWIDMFFIPKESRGRGEGRAMYEEFEKGLPENVTKIMLYSADTGSGPSHGFWDRMGFFFCDADYNEDEDEDEEEYGCHEPTNYMEKIIRQ